ncbi:hypothetical protein Ancab_029995 [Ancistrocladus abbreviatus]
MDSVAPRRHLPSWMLGITAADRACTSESRGGSEDNDFNELARQTCKSKPRGQIKQNHKEVESCGEESMKINSCLMKKREAKGSRRKSRKQVKQIAKGDLEKENCAVIGGNFQDKAPSQKQKAKNFKIQPCSVTEESVSSEDELSVEDLISIAKEYVNMSEDMEQHQRSCIIPRPRNQPSLTNLSQKESKDAHNALQGNGISVRDTLEVANSNATESSSVQQSIINSGKIGDPAQDMLDLFLGPLLKKPLVERKNDVMTDQTMLNYKLSKQSQDDSVEVPLLTKKKCSLKDKVIPLWAMPLPLPSAICIRDI